MLLPPATGTNGKAIAGVPSAVGWSVRVVTAGVISPDRVVVTGVTGVMPEMRYCIAR